MTDFLIIGGGIAGVSAAARLSQHGQVTLLEAEDALAYHASGRSAAMFLKDYGNDTVKALNHASADHLHSAHGGVLTPRGMMLVAHPDQREAFDADWRDLGMEVIDPAEAREKVPILRQDECAFAAYRDDASDLDTDLLIQNFARDARKNGATFVTRARVDKITRTGAGWTVQAGEKSFSAAILVNAAGAWVDQIAQMAGVAPLGFQPFRRSMARLPAPGGHDVSTWPFLDNVGEAWYAKPDAGKWLVSPSEQHPMDPHDAWSDDMVLAEGLARYERMVTTPVTRVETSWAGLRTFAPDRSLVVGFDAADPAFFWLGGQGGYGFQTAPAASALAADLIAGQTPSLDRSIVAALSPHRF